MFLLKYNKKIIIKVICLFRISALFFVLHTIQYRFSVTLDLILKLHISNKSTSNAKLSTYLEMI